MTQTISICNLKGGVGKTTTAANLGVCLGRMGFRTLLVDFDSQCNLGTMFGVRLAPGDPGVPEWLMDQAVAARDISVEVGPNLVLLPSNPNLADTQALESLLRPHEQLARRLRSIDESFDYVVIDNGCALSTLAVNSLGCSDWVMVPANPDQLSLEGMSRVLDLQEQIVEQELNPTLKFMGVVMTQTKKGTVLLREARRFIEESFGEEYIMGEIPQAEAVRQAVTRGEPVMVAQPAHKVSEAYRELAQVVLARTSVSAESRSVA